MRNKIRIKEAELVMVRGKTQLFVGLRSDESPESSFQRHSLVEDYVIPRQGRGYAVCDACTLYQGNSLLVECPCPIINTHVHVGSAHTFSVGPKAIS